MNDRLVHGPYSQERRSELLLELLQAQKAVRECGADQGFANIELISIDELQEIRRLWVVEKGEIEDLVPTIYEKVFAPAPYPGRDLDPMPLDSEDLKLLWHVAANWVDENAADGDAQQRTAELYKLTRTVLAAGFRGLQSRRRSDQLNELQRLLSNFAFVDEADALEFARAHLGESTNTAGHDSQPVPGVEEPDVAYDVAEAKVIPIYNALV
jgi:DNA sulfur modification protein DndC